MNGASCYQMAGGRPDEVLGTDAQSLDDSDLFTSYRSRDTTLATAPRRVAVRSRSHERRRQDIRLPSGPGGCAAGRAPQSADRDVWLWDGAARLGRLCGQRRSRLVSAKMLPSQSSRPADGLALLRIRYAPPCTMRQRLIAHIETADEQKVHQIYRSVFSDDVLVPAASGTLPAMSDSNLH